MGDHLSVSGEAVVDMSSRVTDTGDGARVGGRGGEVEDKRTRQTFSPAVREAQRHHLCHRASILLIQSSCEHSERKG